jgi:hypothetical protein
MAQSLVNNDAAQVCHRVTGRINDPVPYAEFNHPDVSHGYPDCQGSGTGSAVFISESLWMGGFPLTYDLDGTAPPTGYKADQGWRYFSASGNRTFNEHQHIVRYYTDSFTYFPTTGDNREHNSVLLHANGVQGTLVPTELREIGNVEGAPVDNDGVPIPTIFRTSMEALINLSNGQIEGNTPEDKNANAELLSRIIQCSLVSYDPLVTDHSLCTPAIDDPWIQRGDYSWIRPGSETGHGMLVVGWAETLDCSEAISTNFYGTTNIIAATLEDAGGFGTKVVPYVVDFNNRLQSQRPRPFYCTAYLENQYSPGNFAIHNWWFYTMPDEVHLTVIQLYVNPNWEWVEEQEQ